MDVGARLGFFGIFFTALGFPVVALGGVAIPALVIFVTFTLLAELAMCSPSHRQKLGDHLTTDRFPALYQRLMRPIAEWPRDWRLYDWALRLAVFYPIGFLVVWWAWTGRQGAIGTIEVLPEEERVWPRAAMLGALALALLAPHLVKWSAASPNSCLRRFSGWLPLVAGAGAIAAAFAVALAVSFAGAGDGALAGAVAGAAAGAVAFADVCAGAVAIAVLTAGALAGAVSVGGAGALAVLVAGAGAGVVALAVGRSARRGNGDLAYIALTSSITGAIVGGLWLVDWIKVGNDFRSVFLFLGMLPLLNAVFDYLSYVVTLSLIRSGLGAGWGAALLGLADLLVAGVLLTLSGATMILALAAAHALAGEPLFPLGQLFDGIRATPGDYWWLYLMLFSTVLPTVAHFAAATFSLAGLVRPSWRKSLVGWIESEDAVHRTLAPLAVGIIWLAAVALPLAVLWGFFRLAGAFGAHPVGCYLDLMEDLAGAVGAM